MLLRRKEEPKSESETQRIEAFSDGVFAIAITLLILEIHLPHLTHADTGERLRHEILTLWPSYFAYIFSFITVGIYWANHHYIFKIYKRTDHGFNLLNVFFLMCISFLPLPTAVLGEYVLEENKRQTAVLFYNFGLLLPALSWSLIWVYASYKHRLIDSRLEPRFVRYLTGQYMLSNLVYLLSLAAAVWSATLGLIIAVLQTFLYLLPSKPPVYRSEEKALPDEPGRLHRKGRQG